MSKEIEEEFEDLFYYYTSKDVESIYKFNSKREEIINLYESQQKQIDQLKEENSKIKCIVVDRDIDISDLQKENKELREKIKENCRTFTPSLTTTSLNCSYCGKSKWHHNL